MIPALETNRLTLTPLSLDDAPATQKYFPHWEIVRYLSAKVPWPYPDDGAVRFIKNVAIPAMERGEQWLWAIRLKEGPAHQIGCINLGVARDENRGFWLGLPWHNRRIMSESCEAVTEFWFSVLKRDKLRVAKAADNIASRRISEREGGRIVERVERNYVIGKVTAEIWELTFENWQAARRMKEHAAA
ncbi:MAG: GNAT family N-acetyltransferase [Rhodomicrobium sp.]|jgi:RimJ/RimL family protein N-acetyltransferase